MSRLCRLEVRSSNQRSLLILRLIANNRAQRIYGCGQAGGPRTTMMSNIASPWRYDTAASHARAPSNTRPLTSWCGAPGAAVFRCHGRLSRRALNHCRDRVNVRCRGKPRSTMLRLGISQFVKGFGCRPLERRRRVFGGRRPKASKGDAMGRRRGYCIRRR
jgi:hypothetical protein